MYNKTKDMAKVRYCTGDSCEMKTVKNSYIMNIGLSILATGLAKYYSWDGVSYAFGALTAIFLIAWYKDKNSDDAMQALSSVLEKNQLDSW